MRLPTATDAASLPMNVLFPEAYRASCRMIVRDLSFFGTSLVVMVSGLAYFFG